MKTKRRLDFSPEANLVKLIAELIFKIVKLFWYRRHLNLLEKVLEKSLNLLEKVLEGPGKVLEFAR